MAHLCLDEDLRHGYDKTTDTHAAIVAECYKLSHYGRIGTRCGMWCGVRHAATFDPHATFVSAVYVSRLVHAARLDLVRRVEKLRHVQHCGECATQ